MRCGIATRGSARHQIQGAPHRGVTDRVDGRRDARQGGIRIAAAASSSEVIGIPRSRVPSNGSSIHAVRLPRLPSRNILMPPIRSQSVPTPLRIPRRMQGRQRGHRRMKQDPKPQRARVLEAPERGERRIAFHIVDAGQPQAVRLGLRLMQRLVQHGGRRLREMRQHQLDRALEQEAGRLARAVAHDASAERVRRRATDASHGQRSAIHPGGMHIERVEIHRSRLQRVERRRGRGDATSRWHPTPAPPPTPAPDAPTLPAGAPPRANRRPPARPAGDSGPRAQSGCGRQRSPA